MFIVVVLNAHEMVAIIIHEHLVVLEFVPLCTISVRLCCVFSTCVCLCWTFHDKSAFERHLFLLLIKYEVVLLQ